MDIDSYIESVYTLLFGALNSCVSLISYTIILGSLSDVIKIGPFPIYGYMLWAVLVYAGLGMKSRQTFGYKSLKNCLLLSKYDRFYYSPNGQKSE